MKTEKKIEAEIKFVDLLKDPLRLFGWVFPYFAVMLILVGVFYLRNLDDIAKNEAPEAIIERAEVKRAVKSQKGGIIPPIDLGKIKSADDDLLALGKEVYSQNCASCHGEEGLGDGAAGANLDPKPRNFHDVNGWTNGAGFAEVYGTLQNGIVKNGMAAYEYLPVEEKVAVIHFLRTFAEYPEATDEEIQLMDMQYSLSKGEQRPNTIPIPAAVGKIIAENQGISERVDLLRKYYASHDTDDGILHKYISCEVKVFNVVLGTDILKNSETLRQAVSFTPSDLGFSAEILTLSDAEWKDLYKELKRMVDLT